VRMSANNILIFDGSTPGLTLMRRRSVRAFESSSPSSEFTKRYEWQILKLTGFVERYCQIKWIFPSIMASIK
jgi:hypothetical protein